MSSMQVYVGANGTMPTRGTANAAGFDLYAAQDQVITGKCAVVNKIPLDIKIALPRGTYGRIAGRSGIAFMHGANVLAGVIDADYRGEVAVLMTSVFDFAIKKGDRIAQLILEKYDDAPAVRVESVSDLGNTQRGESGFGSTGN